MENTIVREELSVEQKAAIAKLIDHVFGSHDNYGLFKRSGKAFPADYKLCKSAIVGKVFGIEKIETLISLCCTALIPQNSSSVEHSSLKGHSGKKVTVENKGLICDSTNHIRGGRKPSTPRNDELLATYKLRIGCNQSKRRMANWTESEIYEFSVDYTKKYNETFGTDFDVFISEKREKKV